VLEADTTLYSPFRDLFREVNEPDDAVWRERVEQYVDLNYLVTYVAIENFMSEWDGFAGNYGMNNFFVYRRDGSTRLQMLPWDRDSAMLDPNSSIFFHNDENELVRRALSYSDLRERYFTVLENCAQSATEDDWFEREAASTAALIAAAAHEDARKPYTNDEFDDEVEFIKNYAHLRPSEVLIQVASARASSGY
jgi:spore coat protein CotH